MRGLVKSATKTFPLPSTATPVGLANCPSPLPWLPHLVRNMPLLSNFWMRGLPKSATKTFPLPSTATPVGLANCPSPLPWLPHLVTKVPGVVLHAQPQLFWPDTCPQTCPLAQPQAGGQDPPHVGAWRLVHVLSEATHVQ